MEQSTLNAHGSKRQYSGQFQLFLDYLQTIALTTDEKANSFYKVIEKMGDLLETELLKFFML